MIIKRDLYLRQLISSRNNGLIKIITGIRRCGKSFLLSEIYYEYLIGEGVEDTNIINIPLDDRSFAELRDPDAMLNYIRSRLTNKKMHYVFIDEVQMLNEFVDVLNSLLHIKNVDVYVTGSNSRFLSKDVATEFRGRGDEIHLYPLSFSEYYSAFGGNKQDRWREYYTLGGIPQMLAFNDRERKENFLISLYSSTYLNDIFERHRIKNKAEFEELASVISSSIGAPCNPTKLSNTFRSAKGIVIDKKTVSRYLELMQDAFLIERSIRYDVKGKKYINTLSKYYFQDLGIRNAILNFRQLEESHIMENVIYNELRIRGYRVDVGITECRTTNKDNKTVRQTLEVDFVCNKGSERIYIQSVFAMPDEAKKEQESGSLKAIGDSFKKVIIVKDNIMPYYDNNGFLIIGLFDFLLNPDVLDI